MTVQSKFKGCGIWNMSKWGNEFIIIRMERFRGLKITTNRKAIMTVYIAMENGNIKINKV